MTYSRSLHLLSFCLARGSWRWRLLLLLLLLLLRLESLEAAEGKVEGLRGGGGEGGRRAGVQLEVEPGAQPARGQTANTGDIKSAI